MADEDQPERRDELWRSRVGHLLHGLWPREIEKQCADVWGWLLRMAIALDGCFVEAVQALQGLPHPATIENGGLFDELADAHHPDNRNRAAAVRWLLQLPIYRWSADDERIADIKSRLAALGP